VAAAVYGVSSRRAAHNRAELAELSRQHAIDAERARLARDLHDAVGHAVTLMLTYAGAARLSLADGEGPVHTALSRIEESGRAAMDDLDRVLQVLDPDGGTVPALDERLRALVRVPGVRATLRLTGPDDAASLPGAVQEAVYRIVQESLTNVVRHSGATTAQVIVHQDTDGVRVTVTDDGTASLALVASGPVGESSPARGVAGMTARARELRGTLTAGPSPEGGWRVDAYLPLAPRGDR
jgi:signal transduction histidine kinase